MNPNVSNPVQMESIQKAIFQALSSKGPWFGWQERVGIHERMQVVYHLLSAFQSLSMQRDIRPALVSAYNAEDAFFRSESKEQYLARFRQKMNELKAIKLQQMGPMQNGMIQNPAFPSNPQLNQAQASAFPHVSRPMPAPQMSMQMGQPMGRGMPNQLGIPPPALNQSPTQQQPSLQRAAPALSEIGLTQQEMEMVLQRSNFYYQNLTEQNRTQIMTAVNHSPLTRHQSFAQGNGNPVLGFLRSRFLLQEKRRKMQRVQAQLAQHAPGLAPSANGSEQLKVQPPRIGMAQPVLRMQGNSSINPQSIDQGFAGNADSIQGRAVNGLATQETGNLLSKGQIMNPAAPQAAVFQPGQRLPAQASLTPQARFGQLQDATASHAQQKPMSHLNQPVQNPMAIPNIPRAPPTTLDTVTQETTQPSVEPGLPPSMSMQPDQFNQTFSRVFPGAQGVPRPNQTQMVPQGITGSNQPDQKMNVPQWPISSQVPAGSTLPNEKHVNTMQQKQLHPIFFQQMEQRVREYDATKYPLELKQALKMSPPSDVVTWGQLKNWLRQNSQIQENEQKLTKILLYQRNQVIQIIRGQLPGHNPGKDAPRSQIPAVPALPGQQNPIRPNVPPQRNISAAVSVTPQDLQFYRQKHAQFRNMDDNKLQKIIEGHKTMYAARVSGMGLKPQTTSQTLPQQLPLQKSVPSRPLQSIVASPNPNQLQSSAPVGNKNNEAASSGNLAKPVPSPTKSSINPLKRSHPDDTTPNMGTSITSSPSVPQIPAQAGTNLPAAKQPVPLSTRQSLDNLNPQQRAFIEGQMRKNQQAHQMRQVQSIPKAAIEAQWNRLPDDILKKYHEIYQRPSQPVQLDYFQKQLMTNRLPQLIPMIAQMEKLVIMLYKTPDKRQHLPGVLEIRANLMKQFKDPNWTVADHFTVSPEYIQRVTDNLKKLYLSYRNVGLRGSNANEPARAGPQLNASNLQQLEQQEALRKNNQASTPQPNQTAPQIPQPAFQIGNQSPQGVPRYAKPGGLSPDDLKLPPASKRRKNSVANAKTPGLSVPTPASPQAKHVPADTTKTPAPAMFKCAIAECQHHDKGFSTMAALDAHVQEEHQEQEINDPLGYALESFALSAQTFEKTQSQLLKESQRTEMYLSAQADRGSTAKQGVKMESGGSGSTPLGHTPSRAGPNSTQTPSLPSATPALSKSRGMPVSKTAQGLDNKLNTETQSPKYDGLKELKSNWPSSNAFTVEIVQDTFGNFEDEFFHGLRPDPVDEDLASDTPPSAVTDPDTQPTPDISPRNDMAPKDNNTSPEVRDKETKVQDDEWVGSGFLNSSGQFEDALVGRDCFEDINWDALDVQDLDMETAPPVIL